MLTSSRWLHLFSYSTEFPMVLFCMVKLWIVSNLNDVQIWMGFKFFFFLGKGFHVELSTFHHEQFKLSIMHDGRPGRRWPVTHSDPARPGPVQKTKGPSRQHRAHSTPAGSSSLPSLRVSSGCLFRRRPRPATFLHSSTPMATSKATTLTEIDQNNACLVLPQVP